MLQHAGSSILLLFFLQRFRRKKTVGPMNSKLFLFLYQTDCICVLFKTQTQPRYQTTLKQLMTLSCEKKKSCSLNILIPVLNLSSTVTTQNTLSLLPPEPSLIALKKAIATFSRGSLW